MIECYVSISSKTQIAMFSLSKNGYFNMQLSRVVFFVTTSSILTLTVFAEHNSDQPTQAVQDNLLNALRTLNQRINFDAISFMNMPSNLSLPAKTSEGLRAKLGKQTNDGQQTYFGNGTTEEMVHKRGDTNPSWACETRVHWRDMGNLHYPRMVKEVICRGNSLTCFDGFYSCRPVYYNLHVLTVRQNNAYDNNSPILPHLLRRNWKFISVDISVGCHCGN